ncbi:hypothetical protein AURDEDRAFT_172869 [Auricularia subglabra TFB-10046 SS5]|uniref:Uncharacterized protein n=1 Tax=Auricularia subglabra (strain TFB-10046 / SS5) TaxID=717982 RepID=J0D106_AURST|nr:hypothetical protein AURDEDRAFT_172869 [Auricularia subglabra TFB-10046 SS5]
MARIKKKRTTHRPEQAPLRKAHQEHVLCLTVYEIAASSTGVYANLNSARELITDFETPFWEPIDTAWSAAIFADRLFAGIRYLARQTSLSDTLTREAYIIHDIVQILGDKRLIKIFAPYIDHIDRKIEGSLPPEAALDEEDVLEYGDDE